MAKTHLILAIETSSRIGSVALAHGAELLGETSFSSPLKHSAEIFPAISDLLRRFERKPDQIGHIYISGGPGSFTGLRIAATLAKTMHVAGGVKIVSVDTLDVVAANVIDLTEDDCSIGDMPQDASYERVATIVDAKRGQFFVAAYERGSSGADQPADSGSWRKVLPDCLMRPEQFITEFAGWAKEIWLLGDGLVYYKDKFEAEGVRFFDEKHWSPRAAKVYVLGRQMATRGEFADPLTLVPNYLRRPDVKTKTV
jgi:tRNA threonylcarbamoyladenosine biosynthesis protein TsaB